MTPTTGYQITFPAREQAELTAVAEETAPLAEHEVAGRTLASLISSGTELANYQGQGGNFPINPGYASVFRVEAVGRQVTDAHAGDLAFGMGPHRSFQRLQRDAVILLPPQTSPEVAVFARMMGVSMTTLTTTTARPPATVLVSGLGLVGNMAAQVFARCGYDVIACDPAAARRDLATRVGIAQVLPAAPLDDPTIAGHVALVVECSGHEQGALDGCRIVQKRGEVVLVGVPWAPRTSLLAHEILHTVFHRYAVLRSGWEWEAPLHHTEFRTNSIFEHLTAAVRWLAEGRINVDGLYTKVSPRDAQQAYQDLLHNRSTHPGIVFDWAEGLA